MFTAIAPQCALHESGYTVEVLDRNSIGYRDEQLTAVIKVEFGPITGLYVDTLDVRGREHEISVSEKERARVLSRIQSGMQFLGIPFEHAFMAADG
jgi:hypothetical protein